MNTGKYLLILMIGIATSLVNAQDKKNKPKEEKKTKLEKTVQNEESLDTINIYGDTITLDGAMTDQQGYDAVYDDNYSSDYVGKKRLDSYRGTTPSDLLSSFAGIYSGDARNSGAIDPNIRGIQGEGRVVTRIDGTEQAISVNRGYNGASNRNYIDPLLTSNIRIVKDAGLDTGVPAGVGGAIQIRTLGVNDFIGDEGGFGGEIRIEGSSNSTDPRVDPDYHGTKFADIPGIEKPHSGWVFDKGTGPYTQSHQHKTTGDQLNFFNGNDYAIRIALGYKAQDWDVMGAIAKRHRGNYFAGNNNKSFYDQEEQDGYRKTTNMAKYFKPGEEVFNSSNNMDSLLLKTNWQPNTEQKISFSIRRSKSAYGEIMPSKILRHTTKKVGVQWPLSHITSDAVSLKYFLNPQDNKYLNLKTNLWMTKTDSDAYNAGGEILQVDDKGTPDDSDDVVLNLAKVNVQHSRYGLDISNKFTITDAINVNVFGSVQHEDIGSKIPGAGYVESWTQAPREGSRQEYGIGFNTNWHVNDRLTLDFGGKYSSYWMFDELYDKALKGEITGLHIGKPDREERSFEYDVVDEVAFKTWFDDYKIGRTKRKFERMKRKYDGFVSSGSIDPTMISLEDYVGWKARGRTGYKGPRETITVVWEPDTNGKYSLKNHPCLDGRINKNIKGMLVNPKIKTSTCPAKSQYKLITDKNYQVKKQRGAKFVPAIAMNYQINDDARVYARYNESVRFPSTLEGLVSFGARSPGTMVGLKPEHSHKFEIGYVHNLSSYFSQAQSADIKLSFYQNIIKDVIDRDSAYNVFNLDKQTTRGVELQGRYDGGKFFADLGISHILKNEFCDEHSAAISTNHNIKRGSHKIVPRCVPDGFNKSYSLTRSVPRTSVKLHLGSRLLDEKLQLGTRFTYYTKTDGSSRDNYLNSLSFNPSTNPVYRWDNTFLIDAYARYKINKNFSLEVSGNNLTDKYFIDPASRTARPAPGRSIKMSFTGRF